MQNIDLIIATSIFAVLFLIFVISTLKEFSEINKKEK